MIGCISYPDLTVKIDDCVRGQQGHFFKAPTHAYLGRCYTTIKLEESAVRTNDIRQIHREHGMKLKDLVHRGDRKNRPVINI